jgi:hypothetical protein
MTEWIARERQLCASQMVGIDIFDLETVDRNPIVVATEDIAAGTYKDGG